MRPFSIEFARAELDVLPAAIEIGQEEYGVVFDETSGHVYQRCADRVQVFPIEYVLGGKNVFYFLTPMSKGRLQVLPLGFDVNKDEWFDAAGSMLRHSPDWNDSAVDWQSRSFTFNASCSSCHVSQLAKNYDLATDSYETTWRATGIACESCHGPGAEHVQACATAKDNPPTNLKIIKASEFTPDQTNALCASCHAKMRPLTNSFGPGDRFFDHYDLVTLEDWDFFPDGRDLGENYTFTGWLLNPCAGSGELDCAHCHTPSGRFKFSNQTLNDACMPCHSEYVSRPAGHTHHGPESAGNQCIACHMPETWFARMHRRDHSMLPPTPVTTIAFASPNACNLCHTDRDAHWADRQVREWYDSDYQEPLFRRAGLIDAARREDWTRLGEILAYVSSTGRDEVYAASLIRLLARCNREEKWSAVLQALKDSSPLVRASAASILAMNPDPAVLDPLLMATKDDYKLVRVRAARSLLGRSDAGLSYQSRVQLYRAFDEYKETLQCASDDPSSHHNLGDYYLARGQLQLAAASFETAVAMDPGFVPPLVNVSIVYARLGRTSEAEFSLRKALALDPDNSAAYFNLGLLLSEQGRDQAARDAFRSALKCDPDYAEAAYNLGIALADEQNDAAIPWLRKAVALRGRESKHLYALAFFLRRRGDVREAEVLLRRLIAMHPTHTDAYVLLGAVYEQLGSFAELRGLYSEILNNRHLTSDAKLYLADSLTARLPDAD